MCDNDIVYGNDNSPKVDTQEQMEIGVLGLDIWRTNMITTLADDLVKQILEGIKTDRAATSIEFKAQNADVIYGVIHSFVQVHGYKKSEHLALYQQLFETPLLLTSGEYYKDEAMHLLQECSVSKYMEAVIKKLDEENRRSLKYLHSRLLSLKCFTYIFLIH